MNLGYALDLAAQRYPEAEAIITDTKRLSFGEWNAIVSSVAVNLMEMGVSSGDRVAICAASGEPSATMFFAVHKAGAVAVMLNARWKFQDIAYAMLDAGVKAIFYDQSTKEEIRKAINVCARNIIRIYSGRDNDGEEIHYSTITGRAAGDITVDRNGGSTGTILYTSGTTGKPKGVCRSCRSDYLSSLAIILEHRWERFERVLAVMPLYHTMGLHTLISLVLLNGTAILLPAVNVTECVHYLERGEVTALYLVPTIYHDLVRHIQAAGKKVAVNKLAFAGAPMPQKLVKDCSAVFHPRVFVNQYGCTEMLAITTNARLHEKPSAAGRPALHTRLRIVPADRSRKVAVGEELPSGEVGEVIIEASASPQAFECYLNKPEATALALRDGWYFTGDLGFLDGDGDLYLAGRVDDMIITGGENVYPEEVEVILLRHPGVSEVAVAGLPDQRWGQMVTAFVVPAESELTAAELEKFCLDSAELARFKRPRKYVFVTEIPKSPTGKILRSHLKAQ